MVLLTDKPIELTDLLSRADDEGSGGTVLFTGQVRNHSQGEEVVALEYEAYQPMALKQMETIRDETTKKWPVRKIAIVHRTGYLKVGEVSVAIAVSCAHRADAFEACRYAIDTLKRTVPIWKKEYRPDGSYWVEGYQAERIDAEH